MFTKVRYENVYPGVDLVYHGNHRQLEYDFVIAPGASPNVIRMSFDGLVGGPDAVFSRLDGQGNLILRISGGRAELRLPFVYQQDGEMRQRISCHYARLGNHQVGFIVGAYDRRKPLIIDPVLSYSTYLGGTLDDIPSGIAVDSSGSAYVVGSTSSADFPTTSGTLQATLKGIEDVFVSKLSADGRSLIYSTYLGGSGDDVGRGIAVDSGGNAYITGQTSSNDFPTTAGVFQTAAKGSAGNAFVAKLAPDGKSLVYSTYLGGTGINGGDFGSGIAVDSAGSVYVVGDTGSVDFPTTSGAFRTVAGGGLDAFAAKLAADGKSLVYSSYLGGTGEDQAFGIAVDTALSAYVTGVTHSVNYPTTAGVVQSALKGQFNAFVSKLAPDGKTLVYSTYLGGTGSHDGDVGFGIAVDSAFNAYVAGGTGSTDFPTMSAFQATYGGGPSDVFLTKLNPSGSSLLYSTFLGGFARDAGFGIALDSTGNAYLTGRGDSGTFPVVSAVQPVCGGCQQGGPDAFVARIDPTQSGATSLKYSSFLGGTSQDLGTGIAVDGSGNAYVAGFTSSGFPITPGSFQVSPGGNAEGFVVKISPSAAPSFTLTQASLDFGNQVVGTNTSLTVVVGNAGTATLHISSITLTGTNSGEFSETDTCSAIVSGGGNCNLTVSFSPVTTGTKTAVITFSDDASSSPQSLNLLGAGVPPAPALSVSPTSVNFGNRPVGTTGTSQDVTLTSTGNAPVTFSNISLTGANTGDFVESTNCPLSPGTLGPSVSCIVSTNFKPTALGNRAATLTITDNASGSPQSVSLTGVGIAAPDFTITASPSTTTVAAGQPTSYTLTLTPVNGFTGTIRLSCTGAPNLATCTPPASVAITGTTPAMALAPVTTTAHSIVAPPRSFRQFWPRGEPRIWWPFLLLFLTLAVLANLAARSVNNRLAYLGFAGTLLFVFLLVSGCAKSSGGGNTGTPSGSYTLTFTGNSGGLSHTTTVTLNVN